jgi:TPR repeat protein
MRGNGEAVNNLGLLYMEGNENSLAPLGTAPGADPEMGIPWFRLAAMPGNDRGQYNPGTMYLNLKFTVPFTLTNYLERLYRNAIL